VRGVGIEGDGFVEPLDGFFGLRAIVGCGGPAIASPKTCRGRSTIIRIGWVRKTAAVTC
jgi:hypothetical protein